MDAKQTISPNQHEWHGFISITSYLVEGIHHISYEVRVEGDHSAEASQNAAAYLMDLLRTDKLTLVRCLPEGQSETDFEAETTSHCGYCRFSVCPDTTGEMKVSMYARKDGPTVTYLGLAGNPTSGSKQ